MIHRRGLVLAGIALLSLAAAGAQVSGSENTPPAAGRGGEIGLDDRPAAGAGSATPSTTFSVTRPPKPGETCLLCGRPMGDGDADYLIRGRWVPVHAGPCDDAFRKNPEIAFASLQPKGALFQEEFDQPKALRLGWFLAGAWVLSALASAAACVHLAWPRGLPPVRWFAAGLAFNLLAVLYLITVVRPMKAMPPHLGRLHDQPDPVLCGACGGENHPSARRCSGCGGALTPSAEPEVRRALPGRG